MNQMNSAYMKDIMTEVCKAANKACLSQVTKLLRHPHTFTVHNTGLNGTPTKENCVGTLMDVCGTAWLELDGRSPVVKYAKSVGYNEGDWFMFKGTYGGYHMGFRTGRQELSANKAGVNMAAEVLRRYGFKVNVQSHID